MLIQGYFYQILEQGNAHFSYSIKFVVGLVAPNMAPKSRTLVCATDGRSVASRDVRSVRVWVLSCGPVGVGYVGGRRGRGRGPFVSQGELLGLLLIWQFSAGNLVGTAKKPFRFAAKTVKPRATPTGPRAGGPTGWPRAGSLALKPC